MKKYTLTIFLCLFSFFVVSQERQMPIDEIEVTAEPSLVRLRTRMWEAEQEAYDTFNKFNDERRFHITCSMQAPSGSRIERQVCRPGFKIEATAVHGRAYWESLRAFLDPYDENYTPHQSHQHLEATIARQHKEYKLKLKQVAEEHPEFLAAIVRYTEIQAQYKQQSTRAMDGD